MKRFSLSVLALLLSLAGSLSAQNLPSYVPANGLVGWWPFNGNANDESGNGNHGTVNGATLTTDRFGNTNKAFNLDGSNNYIDIGDPTINSLDFQGGPFTISAWFYANTLNGNDLPLVLKSVGFNANSGDYGIVISNNTGNKVQFGMSLGNGNGSAVASATSVNSGEWNHILIVFNSTSDIKLYYNNNLGLSCFACTSSPITLGNPSTPLRFGWYQTQNTFFNGKIDDIAIYNRALSQQEITALYQGANTTTNCPTFPASLTQGLVGYWPFCGNALDESGNGNHGTVNGATLTKDRFGNQGSAYSFDGMDDFISVQDNNSLDLSNQLTLSAWFRSDSTQLNQGIMGKGGLNSTQTGYALLVNVSNPPSSGIVLQNLPASISQEAYISSGINFQSWHNFTGTFDGSVLKLFLDGLLVATKNTGITLSNSDANLYFGRELLNFRYFNGSLDDIAIWNRALSQNEISQLYNQGICQTSITVTDTLLIHTGITAYNPVAYQNTLKVWPNPGNQDITLDAGNLSSMQGWKYKVANGLGQMVVNETAISQQQTLINLSTWGGNGIYYLHLINPQGIAVEIKKIVLAP